MVVSFSNKSWQVRRDRQFDALCSNLRRVAPQLALPPLSQEILGNMSPSFVRLQEKLQEYTPRASRLFVEGCFAVSLKSKHMEGDFVTSQCKCPLACISWQQRW